jgi:hypothetical protein
MYVQSFNQLQEDNRIKNQFKLITKPRLIKETNKISPLRVGQSKTILFSEKM